MNLQIYVYGETESGFLDLDPGTALDMEELQPAFDEDLAIGEFSLPVDIRWTEKNRRILGHAQVISGYQGQNNYWKCDVYDRNVPEFVRGKLTILEKIGNTNYRKGKFSASISGSKGLYGSLIKDKKLKDLLLDDKIRWVEGDSRSFAYAVMTGTLAYPYLSFAPVAFEEFIDQERADYSGEFLANDTVNYVVVNGSGDWVFGRATADDPAVAAVSGTEEYMDYRTIPFFKLKYVLRKCFEEFGYRLTGDFADDDAFNDLVIFNNYAIEKYDVNTMEDLNKSITPANHLPDMLISDFLKAVFSFFQLEPKYKANEVALTFKKNKLLNKKIANLEYAKLSDFDLLYPDQQPKNGYKLDYTWDSNDGYNSDRVKDLSSKNLVATVSTKDELASLDIGRDFTTDDIVLVDAENLYYVVADATSDPVTWDIYAERLDAYIKDAGEDDRTFNISTLCTYVAQDPDTGFYVKKNYVGCRQKGSYINNKTALVKNDFALRIFYAKIATTVFSSPTPASFNHSRNFDNTNLVPYSLAWNGPDGMAENFHVQWQNIIQNKETVKIDVLYTQKERDLIENSTVIQIAGVQFLLQEIDRSIPSEGSALLWLVPL